jgi:hypothetical protein
MEGGIFTGLAFSQRRGVGRATLRLKTLRHLRAPRPPHSPHSRVAAGIVTTAFAR